VEEPIFWDSVHTGSNGNYIIAEKIFFLSLPIVQERITNLDLKMDYDMALSREFDSNFNSNDSNSTLGDYYFMLRDFISFYKTPRVFPLIFENF